MTRRIAIALFTMFTASTTFAYRISVWIPPYSAAALVTIQQHGGEIHESNPVWYNINADGTLAKSHANVESLTWRAAMVGSEILPTIQNVFNGSFSGSATAAMLASPTTRAAHEDSIMQTVVMNAYDGIDIDYEGMPNTPAATADFSAFLTSLSNKLHGAGKKLSVAVYSRWPGVSGQRYAQDWAVIGAAADSVKIMTYDYHWSGGPPGAVTPLSWLDLVAAFAEQNLPVGKIAIGLPWYGYDWPRSGGSGKAVTYATATAKAQSANGIITHDENGEATFTYSENGIDRIVYFQDATSYAAKLSLLRDKHPSITALAHWAAGQEDPAIWGVITPPLRGPRRRAVATP